MIKAEDIKLYPMTMDVKGQRTHQEYVDSHANKILNDICGYRLDFATLRQLVDYAEQEQDRLNASQR